MRPILHLLPDLHYHGHARQVTLLAPALRQRGFSPSVFSTSGPGPFAQPLRQKGIPVLGHGGLRKFDLEDWLALRRLLTTDRPELLHVWGLPALGVLWYATLGKRSLLPPLVVSLRSSVLKKKRFQFWDRRLLKSIRAFVVASDPERTVLISAGLPAEKVRVIPPGVPMPEPVADGAVLRTACGIPLDSPLMMGVGHLGSADRFHDAVWAFEMLQFVVPKLQLALVGDGPNRQRLGSYFRAARQSGLGLHFLGFRDDAASLVGLADVVVVPHRRAGGTFATLEAMSAGKPVVASNLPHLANIIRNGETGMLVPPNDPIALARVTLRLMENPPLRDRIGSAARDAVEREFRVDTMTEQFAELYDACVSTR